MRSHSAGDFARAEATGADVHMLGRTVHDRLDALHIGLPGTIGTAVRVGHLDTKSNALIAKFAFGHIPSTSSLVKVFAFTKHRLI